MASGLGGHPKPASDGHLRTGLGLAAAALAGLMAGCKSFRELESLTEELALPMRRQLTIPRRIPDTALRTTVCKLEPESLREGLRRQAKAAHRRKALGPLGPPFGQVAIDGKLRLPHGRPNLDQSWIEGDPHCSCLRSMRWCRGYCLKMCFPKTFVDTPLMELCRWARREPGSYPAQLLSEAEATAMAGKVEEWLTQW